jgi:hypothetical protein
MQQPTAIENFEETFPMKTQPYPTKIHKISGQSLEQPKKFNKMIRLKQFRKNFKCVPGL